ncbi:MAG: SAM-dependent methyltransferase [Rhizobium sp.]|nr:SAM-dependent methyltransferase [Rhizobium sp.]
MLVGVEDCIPVMRCPRTRSELKLLDPDTFVSKDVETGATYKYKIVHGKPILIDFSDSVLSEDALLNSAAQSPVDRHSHSGVSGSIKKLLSPQKEDTRENVRRIIVDLEKKQRPVRLLIVGGGSIGHGMEAIYDHPDIQVFSFDVYDSPYVQFVADGHRIPLQEEYFDAVIVQAVLEHVLQPAQVVSEIWRVLASDGVVYAETPFMQQVHEGPYDFTRFTESGHRYLFRDFERISSGVNGGPGIQFMWSVDHLVRGLFRSTKAGKVAKLAFFWTQYLDRFIPPSYAQDGASGVYFYGRKSQYPISPQDIIKHYQGAQQPVRSAADRQSAGS